HCDLLLRPFRSRAWRRWRLLLGTPRPGARAAPRLLRHVFRASLTEIEPDRRRLYGRRRGRPLRPGQQQLFETLLPQLAITLPETGRLDPRPLFPAGASAVWLEIGFGGGEHLAEQAARHPEIGFIGSEVFENGVAKLLAEIDRRRLGNVRLFANDARPLIEALAPASIGRVFILFPDPWPKQRHHKRRLVAAPTLDCLA